MGAPGSCIAVRQRSHAAGAAAGLVRGICNCQGRHCSPPGPYTSHEPRLKRTKHAMALPPALIPGAEAGAVPAPCGPAACRGVRATLCYDRPPPHFRPTALSDAHELLVRLRPALAAPLHPHDCVAAMYQAPEDGLEVGAREILR
jgi:hypothetical protein